MKKKLRLEVLDPTGATVVTHHFYYEAGEQNRLRLTITDNEYVLNKDGKLVILNQEELGREAERKDNKYCQCKEPQRNTGSNFCTKCLKQIHDNRMRFLVQDGETFNIPAKDDTEEVLERVRRKLFKEEHLSSDNSVKVDNNLTNDLRVEPQYYNPETKKTQELFDVLNPVYTVRYVNHTCGDKGEALYMTVEAKNEREAKHKAMGNEEFTKHIYFKYYDEKYLVAYPATGNYVIGKVLYFEGDPRL